MLSEIQNLDHRLGKYKEELITLYEIAKNDKIMAFAKGRQIVEHIVSELLQNNKKHLLEKNIEYCQMMGMVPSEICTIMHYIRVMGNRQHSGTLKINISERDVKNLINNIVRLYEWFFCEFEDGLKLGEITIKSNAFMLEMYSFIPFYIGNYNNTEKYYSYDSIELKSGTLCFFDDGFSVLIIKENLYCNNVVDYLVKRREKHLSILDDNSDIIHDLRKVRGEHTNIFIHREPDNLEYVMSIHFLDNKLHYVSPRDKRCIVEPSLLGITDDPTDDITDEDIKKAERLLLTIDENISKDVECINCEDHSCLISWANVLFSMQNQDDYLKNKIISYEIILQKLWYKLYLYNKTIEKINQDIKPIDFSSAKKEIFRTKVEYSKLINIDATGSSFSNSLKLVLHDTSRIKELYNNFENNVILLKEMSEVV